MSGTSPEFSLVLEYLLRSKVRETTLEADVAELKHERGNRQQAMLLHAEEVRMLRESASQAEAATKQAEVRLAKKTDECRREFDGLYSLYMTVKEWRASKRGKQQTVAWNKLVAVMDQLEQRLEIPF